MKLELTLFLTDGSYAFECRREADRGQVTTTSAQNLTLIEALEVLHDQISAELALLEQPTRFSSLQRRVRKLERQMKAASRDPVDSANSDR